MDDSRICLMDAHETSCHCVGRISNALSVLDDFRHELGCCVVREWVEYNGMKLILASDVMGIVDSI